MVTQTYEICPRCRGEVLRLHECTIDGVFECFNCWLAHKDEHD